MADFAAEEGIDYHPVQLERNPSLRRDAIAAAKLVGTIRRLRPDVALWGTPKASLFGVAACRVLRVPAIYIVHGLRFEGATGLTRRILVLLEAVTCRLANVVVADGYELREVVEGHRIARRGHVLVLADGSCNGVGPDTPSRGYRAELGLSTDDVVVTFAGRITGDKGIRELSRAWIRVAASRPRAHLLVAGRVDAADPEAPQLLEGLRTLPRTQLLGHVDDLDRLWAETDVNVLPSYREGLPLVVIEAAAARVPTIVSDCTGGREVVEDGVTGRVVPRRDTDALAEAIEGLTGDAALRARMGAAARTRALYRYDRVRLWGELERLLRKTADRYLHR